MKKANTKREGIVLLVCGGREYDNFTYAFIVLDDIAKDHGPIDLLVHGGARGADEAARAWASSRNVKHKAYLAQWGRYGRSAGIVRNIRMLDDSKPDLVVAFPGNQGTTHMKNIARKAGVEVMEISL